jgi:hypothetical protein
MCLIVIASFAYFVVDQTNSASKGQQRELTTGSNKLPPGTPIERTHKDTAHKAIDEASEALTSPFSSITSGSSSQWVIHGVNLVLALLLYGFGLSFLARTLRL